MKTLFSILIISFCLFHSSSNVEALFEKYRVIIRNGIDDPLPLSFHCHSKDDDLGFHVRKLGGDFTFHFGRSFNTKFWCEFWWNGKDLTFDLFNDHLVDDYCGDSIANTCFWLAQKDGFYIANADNPALADLHLVNKW